MRSTLFAIVVTIGTLVIGARVEASQSAQAAAITQLPYPGEVSLVQEQMGWTFRQSAANLPLYLYEPRSPSATCKQCDSQWVPVLALPGESALGDWTIIERKDGQRQWAFQLHPVYTHRHDTPMKATGDGVDGIWHLMPHFRS